MTKQNLTLILTINEKDENEKPETKKSGIVTTSIDEQYTFNLPSMDSPVQNAGSAENFAKEHPATVQEPVADQPGTEQKVDSGPAGRGGRNKQKDMGRKAYR